jgi:hypothetical protein
MRGVDPHRSSGGEAGEEPPAREANELLHAAGDCPAPESDGLPPSDCVPASDCVPSSADGEGLPGGASVLPPQAVSPAKCAIPSHCSPFRRSNSCRVTAALSNGAPTRATRRRGGSVTHTRPITSTFRRDDALRRRALATGLTFLRFIGDRSVRPRADAGDPRRSGPATRPISRGRTWTRTPPEGAARLRSDVACPSPHTTATLFSHHLSIERGGRNRQSNIQCWPLASSLPMDLGPLPRTRMAHSTVRRGAR